MKGVAEERRVEISISSGSWGVEAEIVSGGGGFVGAVREKGLAMV